MSYFADLTPHTYTRTDGLNVLNVGWLDEEYPFETGETSSEFQSALHVLCLHPSYLHRGVHECQYCIAEHLGNVVPSERCGNGQVRILASNGVWYAAPTLVHHYVTRHTYLPPQVFIDAVLKPVAVSIR